MKVEIKFTDISINTLAQMQIIFGNRLEITDFFREKQLANVMFVSEFPDDSEPIAEELFNLVIKMVSEINIKVLNCLVRDIGLASHTINCLEHAKIKTVKELIGQTERSLLNVLGIDKGTIKDIKKALARVGLMLKE